MVDLVVSEVGPRDGLQNIDYILPTQDKCRWIEALAAAGLREIEVGSCVSPKAVPQMADTPEVAAFARRLNTEIAILIPNLKGLKRALTANPQKISIPFSVSETHSLKNLNRTHAQMLDGVEEICAYLRTLPADERPEFEGGLSTAFGCTLEGPVPEDRVVTLAEQLMAAGCDGVGLADTTGYANPAQVRRLIRRVKAAVGEQNLSSVHLHNTRGQGLANALAALEEGITTLDSSMAGLGGCPFAPGASGNIVTEDLVFMLEAMGLNTGIDYDGLIRARELLQKLLPKAVELYGFTPAAGLPKGLCIRGDSQGDSLYVASPG